MKLSEVYNKPLKEVIEMFELANLKVYADEHANVKTIELQYIEKEAESEPKMPATKHYPWE